MFNNEAVSNHTFLAVLSPSMQTTIPTLQSLMSLQKSTMVSSRGSCVDIKGGLLLVFCGLNETPSYVGAELHQWSRISFVIRGAI